MAETQEDQKNVTCIRTSIYVNDLSIITIKHFIAEEGGGRTRQLRFLIQHHWS